MSTSTSTPPPRPILTRASRNGLWLGLYLTGLALGFGLGTSYGIFMLAVFAATLALPLFLYRLLRRSCAEGETPLGFPELWAEGIASFFLGTLLPAAVVYICLRFITPDFFPNLFAMTLAQLDSMGQKEFTDLAEQLRAAGHLPSAIEATSQLISFNIIAGTAMSFICAIAVSVAAKFGPKNQNCKQ